MSLLQWRKSSAVLLSGLLFACSSSQTPAPVGSIDGGYRSGSSVRYVGKQRTLTSNSYTVQKGDTLYSIAFSAGTNVPAIASLNGIEPPYNIYPGQQLRLHVFESQSLGGKSGGGAVVVTQPSVAKPSGQTSQWTEQKTVAAPAPKEYAQKTAQNNNNVSSGSPDWRWPTDGKLVEGFSTAEQGNKGIDIAGKKGQPVFAASDGKVVYAGSALRGYGKLIILKHDDEYLSAYAHNDQLRVQEGQSVKKGMVIADMGSTDAPDVRLHFEIRYKGKSVNPMSYLPKR